MCTASVCENGYIFGEKYLINWTAGEKYLIDWEDIQSSRHKRYAYYSSEDGQVHRDELLETVALLQSLKQGIKEKNDTCQKFYVFRGLSNKTSLVCEECLPAARYALYSICEGSYIAKYHQHSRDIPRCFHCRRRVKSESIASCYDREASTVISRCIRMK